MKKFLFLAALFAFWTSPGQNIHTNAPDLVFPILEEFIAENFKLDTRTLYKINYLDSIVVRDLPLIIVEPGIITKVYGYRHQRGLYSWIEIDSSLLGNKQKFEKTLNHELGHLFDLQHITPIPGTPISDTIYNEIMCIPSLPYHIAPEAFIKAKNNFYKSLHPPK